MLYDLDTGKEHGLVWNGHGNVEKHSVLFHGFFSVGCHSVALACCCLTNPRTDVLILGGANDAPVISG